MLTPAFHCPPVGIREFPGLPVLAHFGPGSYEKSVQSIMAHAPGRVELLGNHTDYNQGVVLSAAIDRGVTVHGASRPDGRVVLTSLAMEKKLDVPVVGFVKQEEEGFGENRVASRARKVPALAFTSAFWQERGFRLPQLATMSTSLWDNGDNSKSSESRFQRNEEPTFVLQ